ncbi:MAG TPA: hypothetical protein VFG91_09965 [Woeseiaceae bacterium]|nr:hypothetical protein [Woeseiaceae bacterium]
MRAGILHLLLAASLPLLAPLAALARDADADAIHWAYSTWFGTGWYRIGDSRDAFAIRYAPRKLVREQAIDKGAQSWRVEVRVPFTVGLEHFPLDDLAGSVDPANFASLSVTPAVNVTVPVTDKWTLRPFAALGWGAVLNGGGSAWTWWAGVRSRYRSEIGALGWSWLYSVAVVGYSPSDGPSSNFWPVTTGFELDYPAGSYELQGEQLYLNWHAAYTWFADDMELVRIGRANDEIRDQWQFGIGINKEDTPIEVWRFRFDRLGLAYRFSTDGELQGIGLVFNSLFDL